MSVWNGPDKQKPTGVVGLQNPPTAIETAAGVISLSAV